MIFGDGQAFRPEIDYIVAVIHIEEVTGGRREMIKVTTTKATHRGIGISVISDNTGQGMKYSCTNDCGKPKAIVSWFPTQGEAIANERHEIDAVLH